MNPTAALLSSELQKLGFWSEWGRYLLAKAPPETLASFMLEGMRSEDTPKRSAFTMFATYIRTRQWTDLREDLKEIVTPEDLSYLSLQGAAEFYAGFRTIVLAQVEEYYRAYREAEPKATTSPVETSSVGTLVDQSTANLRQEISLMIHDEIVLQMETLKKTIIDEMKKYMDDGEDWKGGGQDDTMPK